MDRSHLRILIVDDNREIHGDSRKIVNLDADKTAELNEDESFLSDAPLPSEAKLPTFEISSAFQGQVRVELITRALNIERRYLLAFVDVRMPPGWGGIETIGRMWQIDPDLQVVVCTAYSDYAWTDRLGRLGRTDRWADENQPL